MKYFRTILSAVFLCIITNMYAQTNVLRIPEITYPAGKTLSLPVELENASDVVGVQFDLSVPYELSVDTANQVITNLTKNRITTKSSVKRKVRSGEMQMNTEVLTHTITIASSYIVKITPNSQAAQVHSLP